MTTKQLDFVTQLPRELARTEHIQRAQPTPAVPPRLGHLAAAAQQLSRRGLAAAKVELVNAALLALADHLYDRDPDGVPVHYDPHTGRIGSALPWGPRGYKIWGLRSSESRALRHIMFERTLPNDPQPWLDWDPDSRGWLVNLRGYLSLGRAVIYLQHYPVTLAEWRAAVVATRSDWARTHSPD